MQSSLARLVESNDAIEMHTTDEYESNFEKRDIMLRKGVYPNEYMDSDSTKQGYHLRRLFIVAYLMNITAMKITPMHMQYGKHLSVKPWVIILIYM